jgi:hypothetical protein
MGARTVGQVSQAGTEIAAAIIDSALGGASGELFQTATDEATWDRGVAEAFAAMLAAIARGAGSGAAIGGAVGGAVQVAGKLVRLIARVGRPAAQDFTRIAESAGSDPRRSNTSASTTRSKSGAPSSSRAPAMSPRPSVCVVG